MSPSKGGSLYTHGVPGWPAVILGLCIWVTLVAQPGETATTATPVPEVIPGKVGGWCNETFPCEDQNAGCDNNICVCEFPYQKANMAPSCVIPQGKVGGLCIVNSTTGGYECEDVGASCQFMYSPDSAGYDFRCTCLSSYNTKSSDLTCEVLPGKAGGWCDETSPCEDQHALCVSSSCVCESPYQSDTSTLACVRPQGKVGGECMVNSTTGAYFCEDVSAACQYMYNPVTGYHLRCTCNNGYAITSDFTCEVLPGKVGGWCNETSPCEDQHAGCANNTCVCQTPYQADISALTCVSPQGKVGGECMVNSTTGGYFCEDVSASCQSMYSPVTGYHLRCACNNGYAITSDFTCEVLPGKIDGWCNETSPCEDQHAGCDNNICVCQTPYQADMSALTCVVSPGKVGGVCDANAVVGSVSGTCEDAHAYCWSSYYWGARGECSCRGGFQIRPSDLTCGALPGKVGGWCDETSPCEDQHAGCENNTCVCQSPYEADTVGPTCVSPQGKVGGECMVNSSTGGYFCEDVSASCQSMYSQVTGYHLRCTCNNGYAITSDFSCEVIPGKVYGWCNDTSPCEDQHAGCDNNTCICQSPYQTDISALTCMSPPGKVGSACDVYAVAGSLSGTCEDAHAYCRRSYNWWERGQCSCRDGYQIRPSDLTCEALPGKVGGWCDETSPCEDQLAGCENNTCVCQSPYEADTTGLTCVIPQGKVGGSCIVNSTTGGFFCEDVRAFCQGMYNQLHWRYDWHCTCNSVYYANTPDFTCVVLPGKVGGLCDETSPCEDQLAGCENNTCVCQSPYEADTTGLTCVSPLGKVGGLCMVNSTTGFYFCEDVSASCQYMYSPVTGSHLRCTCNYGYAITSDFTCEVIPGKVGGWCNETCEDQHAGCDNNTCICQTPYQTDIAALTCIIPPGKVGGVCDVYVVAGSLSGTCDDAHAYCRSHYYYWSARGQCSCRDGYQIRPSDLTCGALPGKVGGWCDETFPCEDQLAGCENNICVCQSPYEADTVGPTCVIPQGKVGGSCMVNSTTGGFFCEDLHASCQGMYNQLHWRYDLRCTCNSGYDANTPDFTCEALPGKVGGWCNETSPCEDPYAGCDNNTCVCQSPYQPDKSGLTCVSPQGKVGGLCIVNSTTGGYKCEDVGASCQYMYNPLTGGYDWRCTCNSGYSANTPDFTCAVLPGKVDGWCNETSPCEDPHAGCDNNTCVCQSPYQRDTPRLACVIPPGKVGGVCNVNAAADSPGSCEDAHAYCWSYYYHYYWGASGQCSCKAGYQIRASDLTCEVLPGKVGGWCDETSPCQDPSAGCDNNTCVCQSPYQTDTTGLNCELLPGQIGGWCDDISPCVDQHASCVSSTCVCESPYQSDTSTLTCVSPQGKVGGSCIVNNTTGGLECEDVRASCQYLYNPLTGGYDMRCTCNSGYNTKSSDLTCDY